MKTLLVLRHAKSSHHLPVDDRERPLNERGRKDAPAMGRVARKMGVLPDRVLCSPAVRAHQTAELFLQGCQSEVVREIHDEIYLAEPETLVDLLARQEQGDLFLLVGHNPGLEELVTLVTAGSECGIRFPTAALACIDFDIDDWNRIQDGPVGELRWLLIPKLVHEL